MDPKRFSATALLIARSILLAEATPALRPMLLPRAADLTRKMLAEARAATAFDVASRTRFGRAVLFGVERILLPGILLHYLARKRFLDTLTEEAFAAECRQLVVFGAGLDALAWRRCLAGSGSAWIEIDHSATLDFKRRVYAKEPEGATPRLIATDLVRESPAAALRAHPGFDVGEPALFVTEGLLMYLPPVRVGELFSELAALCSGGSRFAFTFMEARPGKSLAFHNGNRIINWWLRWRSEPFLWGVVRSETGRFVRQHGWQLEVVSSPNELRRRYLRPCGLEEAPLAVGESVALLTKPG